MLIYRLSLLIILLEIGCFTFSPSPVLAHAGEKHGASRNDSPQDHPGTSMPHTETHGMDPSAEVPPSATEQTDLTTATISPPGLFAPGDWVASGFLLVPAGLFALRRKLSA